MVEATSAMSGYIFTFMALAAVAWIAIRLHVHTRAEVARIKALRRRIEERSISASQVLRFHARKTLSLRRERRELVQEMEAVQTDIDRLKAEMIEMTTGERTLWAFDERAPSKADPHRVRIRHHNIREIGPHLDDATVHSWQRGRNYIIWSDDPQRAEVKARSRFPTSRGFIIEYMDVIKNPRLRNRDPGGSQPQA